MRLNASLHLLIAAAAAATLALAPAAHADEGLRLAAGSYTETADGALLLNAEPVRLSHAPALVASSCITVESNHRLRSSSRTQLVNSCTHAVKLSYCIAADDRSAHACSDVGRRGFDSTTIAAGQRLTLANNVPVDADVRWVACQAADNHYSTLIDDGARGECLVGEGPTALASVAAN